MTLIGWIVISLLVVIGSYLSYLFIKDILLNKRLVQYQKSHDMWRIRFSEPFVLKKAVTIVLVFAVTVTLAVSGIFRIPNEPLVINNRTYLNASQVQSKSTIERLIENSNNRGGWLDFGAQNPATESDTAPSDPGSDDSNSEAPDFIDTNTQEEGVDEADIVKTNGYQIFYSPSNNRSIIHVMQVGSNALVTSTVLELGDFYLDSMYLTDKQLVVVGYTYEITPYYYNSEFDRYDYYSWAYTTYTATIRVYDLDTLSVEFELETDNHFYEHRLIDQTLYLVSSKALEGEYRPTFTLTKDGESTTEYLSYNDMYYFEDVAVRNMTVITALNLETYTYTAQAFLGSISYVYATTNAFYTAGIYYEYSLFGNSTTYTHVIKFDIDPAESTFEYVGQKTVRGYIQNQFWMGSYQNLFGIVTGEGWWGNVTNRLYLLDSDDTTDELKQVGYLGEGIGLPGETVRSVRFVGNKVYVTTALQTDPVYTIDFSNPSNPQIINAIKDTGFSTYLHNWNADGSQLIGLGYEGDENGMITGIKLNAYLTVDQETPIASFILPYNNDESEYYAYHYVEAIHNHKALIASPSHGIFAFAVTTYRYFYDFRTEEWHDSSIVSYYLFYIDFDAQNPEDIISQEPIIITHDASEHSWWTYSIDRGVYINGVIYTLSSNQMVSYDLATKSYLQDLKFNN